MNFQSVAQKRAKLLSFSATLLLLCLSYLLAACGGSSTTNSSNPTAAACDKATGFTLYSAQGYDSDVAKAFQQQTGIVTKLDCTRRGSWLVAIACAYRGTALTY